MSFRFASITYSNVIQCTCLILIMWLEKERNYSFLLIIPFLLFFSSFSFPTPLPAPSSAACPPFSPALVILARKTFSHICGST